VLEPEAFPDYPVDELLADLRKRNQFIDGVVVSGGEPTLDAGLPAFLRQLKALGLQAKLDTNALLPQVISALLEEELIDYLAIDVKTTPECYSELHTHPVVVGNLLESVELAKQASIEVEFRTTCVPQLIDAERIDQLGELLRGAPLWVLQQFVPEHSLQESWQQGEAFSQEQIERFAQQAKKYVKQVQLRGL